MTRTRDCANSLRRGRGDREANGQYSIRTRRLLSGGFPAVPLKVMIDCQGFLLWLVSDIMRIPLFLQWYRHFIQRAQCATKMPFLLLIHCFLSHVYCRFIFCWYWSILICDSGTIFRRFLFVVGHGVNMSALFGCSQVFNTSKPAVTGAAVVFKALETPFIEAYFDTFCVRNCLLVVETWLFECSVAAGGVFRAPCPVSTVVRRVFHFYLLFLFRPKVHWKRIHLVLFPCHSYLSLLRYYFLSGVVSFLARRPKMRVNLKNIAT